MATNATMKYQYKWPTYNLCIYPIKLKYGLKDSLWYSELIGVDLIG